MIEGFILFHLLFESFAETKIKIGDEILGVTVQKVTPEIAKEIGLEQAKGVIITDVSPGSTAERAGLQKGDVIFRVGNTAVDDPKKFQSLISEAAKEGGVVLLVKDTRSGRIGYINIPLK